MTHVAVQPFWKKFGRNERILHLSVQLLCGRNYVGDFHILGGFKISPKGEGILLDIRDYLTLSHSEDLMTVELCI